LVMSRNRVDAHPDVKNRVHNRDVPSICLAGQFMLLKKYSGEDQHS